MTAPARNPAVAPTLLALACGFAPLAAGDETPPPPVPVGGATAAAAAAALADYAKERESVRSGGTVAAEFFFARGMRAKDEGRLDDAVKDLVIAADYAPDKAEYRKQLDLVRTMAGLNRDARSFHADALADEAEVRHQELWNDAEAKKERGLAQLAAGEYAEAERSFQLARIRYETMPFSDPRRPGAVREAESLSAEARNRQAQHEQVEAADRARQAVDKQRELRDLGMQIERERIEAMLKRAQRARERRDYDEAILIGEQVLKINRAETRAGDLLVRCRRERHAYLRQMTADRWDEEHKLLSETIRRDMLPQLELVRYSVEWPEIDARRGAPMRGLGEGGQDTAWREDIQKQLEQVVTLNFQDQDLQEVVGFLQKTTGVNFVLDAKVTAKAPPPVTINVDKIRLKHALGFIMNYTGLGYTLRDEAIYISSPDGLAGDKFMILYDVRDLTHEMKSFPGPELDIPKPGEEGSRLLPPIENANAQAGDINQFAEIIKKVVMPASWEGENPNSAEEWNGSLVITATADVHKQIDELLRQLRGQQGVQIHVKVKFLSVENTMLEQIGVAWNNYTNGGGAVPAPSLTTVVPASQIGAYWGDRNWNNVTAARINNPLLPYSTANSLPLPGAAEGFNMQTQTWQIANQFFASAVIQAVEKERRGNVIFEPSVTLFNGQQAHLVNMNQQSYISDYDVNQTQYDPVISVLAYGTVLDVQGIASADRKYITLTLRPTNAQVAAWRRFGPAIAAGGFPGGNTSVSGPAIAGTNPLLIPQLSYQSVRTSVMIPDGGSLVIAGMTNGESARAHSGVPFLSHIPFLGRLFSNNGRQETELRTMLVVNANLIIFDEIEKKL